MLQWHTKGVPLILHQETLDDAKVKVEGATRLHSTNEKALGVPPRLKDRAK